MADTTPCAIENGRAHVTSKNKSGEERNSGGILLPFFLFISLSQVIVLQRNRRLQTGGSVIQRQNYQISENVGALAPFPKFSDFKQALMDRYACNDVEEDPFTCALRVMEMSETEGDSVSIMGNEFIHISGIGAAYNLEGLRRAGITHVISATPVAALRFPGYMEYLRVNVHDDAEPENRIVPHLNSTFEFIEDAREKGGNVLVHCWEGVSRSVSIIMGYLIKKHGMTAKEAYNVVAQTRPNADPNESYWKDLIRYAEQMHKSHRHPHKSHGHHSH